MKVAVIGESEADEAAIRILTGGIVGGPVEPVSGPRLRTRGWPHVLEFLPTVIRHLHDRTDAAVVVVVVDSDDSVVHGPLHAEPGRGNPECRLCRLDDVACVTARALRPTAARSLLRTAVGVAVPAIEAWLLAADDPRVTEANWLQTPSSGPRPYTKARLKWDLYGTDRPSLALATTRATEKARTLVTRLEVLETAFPGGFGPLKRSLLAE